MAATQTPTAPTSPSVLLDAAAEQTRVALMAEAERLSLALRWAQAHPAPVTDAVVDELGDLIMYADQPATLAGEGAPGMSEFAIAEFATACGLSTYQGRALIGAALEAHYRLPRLWSKVMAGDVAVWKLRRVTEQTRRLPPGAAAEVDAALVPVIGTCTYAQIEKTVAAAAARVDDEHEEMERLDRWQQQHLEVRLDAAALNGGLVPVSGLLDYPDALALEARLKTGAALLGEAHPELDLDIRRAMAAGRLGATGDAVSREVVVYTHHEPDQIHDILDIEGRHGRLGHTTIEQIAGWCQLAGTKVTIKPVLELDAELSVDRYEPSAQQREQAILTCPTCVFPGCAKNARGCDLDHITAYAHGGKTTSWNLAPLCRYHHRLKTFGHWTYRRLGRTRFEWTSPSGKHYLVDLTHKRRRTR
ncbi:HNH endonuclease signature motif containing protein [Nocardioides mangrovi]|uniref:HNH endonuclease n=1 Tax=Nocardioides mangrovi TaxID=2874580 RepID=A0ABS7U896_9ACTN|nr:HNH endonuclease signature motif containing protein [Nocardioides mangrovi]MBZ5737199.1 HNH endonuclease [Nocardioides mangrovi]